MVKSTYPLKVMSTGIFKEIFGSFRYKISGFFAGFSCSEFAYFERLNLGHARDAETIAVTGAPSSSYPRTTSSKIAAFEK